MGTPSRLREPRKSVAPRLSRRVNFRFTRSAVACLKSSTLPFAVPTAVMFDLNKASVFVAGHHGMVGSALVRRLRSESCSILTADRHNLDLTRQQDTSATSAHTNLTSSSSPQRRWEASPQTTLSQWTFWPTISRLRKTLLRASHAAGVRKLLFLGSSCIYPKFAPQPMTEEMLLTGALEPTNEWYAVAKIAGIKLCQAYRRQYGCDFISVMPTNLYGPGDNYHPEHSHVPAALIRRFHEAKLAGTAAATVWGSGKARREFLHVDDLADACVFVLKHYSDDGILNIGTGEDITIAQFAADGGTSGWLQRRVCVRYVKAGRYAAKIARCV